MNVKELAREVAKETGEPLYRTNKILLATFKIIRKEIVKAQIIKIKNLLTIFIDVAPEKSFYNVHEKQTAILPRRFVLKIIPSLKLKKLIDGKKTY